MQYGYCVMAIHLWNGAWRWYLHLTKVRKQCYAWRCCGSSEKNGPAFITYYISMYLGLGLGFILYCPVGWFVLSLDPMSSDVEITGYEEPDHLQNASTWRGRWAAGSDRYWSSPATLQDQPAQGQHQRHLGQCFCRDSMHNTVTKKAPAAAIFYTEPFLKWLRSTLQFRK